MLFSIVAGIAWGFISTHVFGLTINDGIWWVVMVLIGIISGLLSVFSHD